MKILFINAEYKEKVVIPKKIIAKLPRKIMLFTTTQLISQIPKLKKQIEQEGKIVLTTKIKHSNDEAQLLGCGLEEIKKDFEAFLYIGDGQFHPEALIIKNDKPVHIYNFTQKKYYKLTTEDAKQIRRKINIAKMKFLTSKNIGVIVTTKQGQNRLKELQLKEKNYPEKKFYYLANNNIEFDRLEDFNFIECFVNTACQRIAYDDYDKFPKPILNLEDLP